MDLVCGQIWAGGGSWRWCRDALVWSTGKRKEIGRKKKAEDPGLLAAGDNHYYASVVLPFLRSCTEAQCYPTAQSPDPSK